MGADGKVVIVGCTDVDDVFDLFDLDEQSDDILQSEVEAIDSESDVDGFGEGEFARWRWVGALVFFGGL